MSIANQFGFGAKPYSATPQRNGTPVTRVTTRNAQPVTKVTHVTELVPEPVTRNVTLEMFEALVARVAALEWDAGLAARMKKSDVFRERVEKAVDKSRAAYMREYRKRQKGAS